MKWCLDYQKYLSGSYVKLETLEIDSLKNLQERGYRLKDNFDFVQVNEL